MTRPRLNASIQGKVFYCFNDGHIRHIRPKRGASRMYAGTIGEWVPFLVLSKEEAAEFEAKAMAMDIVPDWLDEVEKLVTPVDADGLPVVVNGKAARIRQRQRRVLEHRNVSSSNTGNVHHTPDQVPLGSAHALGEARSQQRPPWLCQRCQSGV